MHPFEPLTPPSLTWTGTYRHIRWEIVKWLFHEDKWVFNFYVYLSEGQMPEELRSKLILPCRMVRIAELSPERRVYDYDTSIWNGFNWHCGITYYDILMDWSNRPLVKAGCDYNHLYDEGIVYNENYVYSEVRDCIDSIHERIPNLKGRDLRNGGFKDIKELDASQPPP
jgi:hypothetical protein